jgi:hypothetical protein
MANANTATWSGRSIIWRMVNGAGTTPKNIGWGTSTVTLSANSDVNLFAPATEARTAGTSTLSSSAATKLADTFLVTGTITCAVGAKTITEAALFDTNAALSPTTTVAVSMTAATTVMSLGAASGIAAVTQYYRQIENEVVLVTAGTNTATETLTRGALGSTSAAHASGVATTVGGDGGAASGGATSGQLPAAAIGSAQGGNLFAHADFAGVALNVSDSINFTFANQLA